MSTFAKTVMLWVSLCLALGGRPAWADPITVDLPDVVGDFVHGDAPISSTAIFEDVSGSLSSLLIQITATGTLGFSDVHGELPAEIIVSATDGGPALISPTVLGPYGATSITLEAFNAWGTLDGGLANGGLNGGLTSDVEITVTIATNDINSSVTTAPVVHITSATITATFDPPRDCDWMGCDGFVGLTELDIVLGNWNQAVTPGDYHSGDYNNDGFVGLGDLDMVMVNWNAGTPPADSVPEPAALACFGVGLMYLLRRWRI